MEFANKLFPLNPCINLPTFKEIIFRMIAIKKYKFSISETYLNHYFYNWKNKNRINTFYYAYDNPTILDDNIFLQSLCGKIIFDPEKKKYIKLIYAIWDSPFHINRLRYSPHYYIDFTFIKPIGMLQTMIIMYIDLYTGIKKPGCFIIINSKSQFAYEKVLEDFYRLITNNDNIPIVFKATLQIMKQL